MSAAKNAENGYLARACAEAAGLPEDCDDVVTIRKFMADYLERTEEGCRSLEHYAEISPKIIDAISKRTDPQMIWEEIYQSAVTPCVILIKAGKYPEAAELYKRFTTDLEKICRPLEEEYI